MLIEAGPGHLGPYLKTAEIFHCPADQNRTNLTKRKGPLRVRSYTMNPYIVYADGIGISRLIIRHYSPTAFVKWSDFARVSPSQIFRIA